MFEGIGSAISSALGSKDFWSAALPVAVSTVKDIWSSGESQDEAKRVADENAAERIFQLELAKLKLGQGGGGGGGGGNALLATKLNAQANIQKANQDALNNFIAAYQNAYK